MTSYTKVKVVLASLSSQARFGFSEVAFGVASSLRRS